MSEHPELDAAVTRLWRTAFRAAQLRLLCAEPISDDEVIQLLQDMRVVIPDLDLAGVEGARERFLLILTAVAVDE